MSRSTALLIVAALGLLAPGPARAQEGLGLGIIAGEPTGLSLKTWLSPKTAVDAAAAWSFVDQGAFHVHADYLVHDYGVFHVDRGALPLYYGVGARLKVQNQDPLVGVRVPVGVDYLFAEHPIDLFFELVPILDVTPATRLNLNASVGGRYFFR
jgi:hypothetical protein